MQTQLEWIERSGKRIGDPGPRGIFNSLSLSPDDQSVVYTRQWSYGSVDLHRFDFATRQDTRLTFHPSHDMFPFWSADGRRIFFNSLRVRPPQLFEIAADSTGTERLLLKKDVPTGPSSGTRDGKTLIVP